jgi:tetratricopeptide (TPR) repeat protein
VADGVDASGDVAAPDADTIAAPMAEAGAAAGRDSDIAPRRPTPVDDEMDFAAELRATAEADLTTDLGAAVADELAAEARASAVTESPLPAPESTATGPRRSSRSTMSTLAQSVDSLRGEVSLDAMNWQLRRELGEALLDSGERDQGLAELEAAMVGFERDDDLESARSVADEIIRLKPHSVRHHQKRVEFAFRMSDRARLLESYLELADALFRDGQTEKSRAVYQRVLELSPDDARAQAALRSFVDEAPAPPAPEPRASDEPRRTQMSKRYTAETPIATDIVAPVPAPQPEGDFVNLEDWLREEEAPKSTRMVVEEKEPTGDEDADFNDMLRKFKQGVAQNVEEEDHESHYDLGIAYKEMGLIDEAISEFQKALRGPQHRVRTYEALGQCFMDKHQEQVAITLLHRALAEPGVGDEQLVGVLYLLGLASEAVGEAGEAVKHYQRVFAVDINFRDVKKRMRSLEKSKR